MKKHIYLAGSLFSEAEVAQRLKEGQMIQERLGDDYTCYNPVEAPCNDKEANLPTALDIFMEDAKEVIESDVIIADLANQDPGVMMELGIAWGLNFAAQVIKPMNLSPGQQAFLLHCGVKEKEIHAVLSDIRLSTAHAYANQYIPFGYNQFVIGGIKEMKGKVHRNFEDAIKELEGANE